MPQQHNDELLLSIAGTAEVPEDFCDVLLEIVALTDEFCKRHLNDEYQQLCRKMATDICQLGSPVKRGKRASWACGIVYSVGWMNCLSDPNQNPHLRSEDIAKGFGVSMATMQNKSREIREGLPLVPLDPDFMLASQIDKNPLIWFFNVNGVEVDLRHAPREIQVIAYEQGLIPYIPADDEQTQQTQRARRKCPRPLMPRRDLLMQFKITLKEIEPPVWRRIQIFDCTLDRLHDYIQSAFGWWDYHLHQFMIADERYGNPEILDDGYDDFHVVDSRTTLLSDIVPKDGKRFDFLYEYDFGDDWLHEIQFEGFPAVEKRRAYPLCLEGERAGPPEDVGGPWGYAEYLEAMADPSHERHEQLMEWRGEFDPEEFNLKKATRVMRRMS